MAMASAAVIAEAQTPEPFHHSPAPAAFGALLHEDSPVELGALADAALARIEVPGASYVKVHFSRFDLPDGITVEVTDEALREVYRYRNGAFDSHTLDRTRGDDGRNRFYAMSVTGDTALVRLSGALHRFDPKRHGVVIDSWLAGRDSAAGSDASSKASGESDWQLETTCGINERYDAKCYAESHPAVYDRSIPVARVVTPYGEVCTAWRVGPGNRLFTVQHCISAQDDLDGAEIWFHYRRLDCGGADTTAAVKVSGGELLAADKTLDYALFTVDDFDSISNFGHLGLDVRNGAQGEGIFIPQHGLGQPKQIALESDMNSSGLCEIDDADHDGYADDSDIGYFCDTTTSSSGSPVVSRVTGDVIALHHLGGCFNSATKMSLIWPQVSAFFNGVVPAGDGAVPWDEEEDPEPANRLPEAYFTYACDGLECSFDASASTDGDGFVESYSWNFGDGATTTGSTAVHVFDAAGNYTVTLTARDDQGGTDDYRKSLTVELPEQAPDARISAQCVDNSCRFSGSGSSDPDGHIVSWDWKFGDGTAASGSEVSHLYAAAGTFTITLTVKDDDGLADTRSYTASISMPNQPPLADFDLTCDYLACSVDGAASADPDGAVVAWRWSFGDGLTASGVAARHSYSEGGNYTVTLTVVDNRGAETSTARTASVEAEAPVPEPAPEPEPEPDSEASNQAPSANFDWSCDFERCTFDADGSADADGQIIAWRWDFGDGEKDSGVHATHDYAEGGRFRVSLTVEDDQGATDSRWAYVDVDLPDHSPVAEFSVDCAELNCTLDAGSSTDSAEDIARYDWSFGDGATGEGRTVTHEYSKDGVYRVTLKVTDGDKLSDTRTRSIEVISRRAIELQASAGRPGEQSVALLTWSRAAGDTVTILRNGKPIAEVANTGKFADKGAARLRKAARYQVCEPSGERCSREVIVLFTPMWGSKPPANDPSPLTFKR